MFLFRKEKKLDIVPIEYENPCEANDFVYTIYYEMVVGNRVVGNCDLRLGMNEIIYYAGQIGYHVYPRHRGHNYAYKACLLMFEEAKKRGFKSLIITCSPENIASRKTLEKLNGTLIETCEVPKTHWLWERNERVKNIYKYTL